MADDKKRGGGGGSGRVRDVGRRARLIGRLVLRVVRGLMDAAAEGG